MDLLVLHWLHLTMYSSGFFLMKETVDISIHEFVIQDYHPNGLRYLTADMCQHGSCCMFSESFEVELLEIVTKLT